MTELARPVGLGLAARGPVSDVVDWGHRAGRAGIDSVWIHDSYFERDAVSYAAAIASHVPGIRVAMGALNPFTRHPIVVAMTVSAIDEMAPGRVILGMGTGLPLRLGQMGIPYTPESGVAGVSTAIDTMRALWAGERVPSATEGLPPVQPMFPPVHRVPIYVAAYRSAFLRLAGEKADGYLARPAESIPALTKMLATMREASTARGRPEDAVDVAGYLLTLVDDTRREALNRAKREPFVIYMMAVQSDLAMRRAGFDPELTGRIMALWRAEDYHGAAQLMPDELLDAFMLCGTREEVAARATDYQRAGMNLPLLQPVVQEESQVAAVLDAAVEYGAEGGAGSAWAAETRGSRDVLDQQTLSIPQRLERRLGAWSEIVRPFSFTASTVPVAAAGGLAAVDHRFRWDLFLAALLAALLLHIGTNVINEIYDVRRGIDTITSPRASHALLKGRLTEREAFVLAFSAFGWSVAIGVWLIVERGWPVVALGLAGLVGGLGYTAPPLQYKYRALGLPLVFLLMGPIMVIGSYFVITGTFDGAVVAISVPVGLLVTAILHGNEWRDIGEDARAGIVTFSIRAGRRAAHVGYVSLVVGAYLALSMAVVVKALPPASLLAMLSLPLLVRAIRASELGATGQQRAIAMIDLQTAQLHAAFGFLLVLGLALAATSQ
jgi:1,4-dihydroxy-2-naphthoate octaprenyltransferase